MGNKAGARRWVRVAGAVAVMVMASVLAACGGGSNETDVGTVDVGRGGELYQAKCASCHGADLRGTDQGPSHLSVVYEPNHHSDDSFRAAIANGAPAHHWSFGDMPPVKGLSASEVDAIIAYVRQAQEEQGLD